MQTTTRLPALIAVLLAGLALAACDREAPDATQRGSTTVGQKLDRAIDRTQQELAVAGEKTKQELAVAGEKTKQTLAVAGDRLSAATDKAVGQTREAANEVRNTPYERPASPEGARTGTAAGDTRATLGDAAITASIKTDFLKDPDLSVLKIDVDTRDGVVTLNGLAETAPARERAEKMAAAVKGVKEVRNFLTVKRG